MDEVVPDVGALFGEDEDGGYQEGFIGPLPSSSSSSSSSSSASYVPPPLKLHKPLFARPSDSRSQNQGFVGLMNQGG